MHDQQHLGSGTAHLQVCRGVLFGVASVGIVNNKSGSMHLTRPLSKYLAHMVLGQDACNLGSKKAADCNSRTAKQRKNLCNLYKNPVTCVAKLISGSKLALVG